MAARRPCHSLRLLANPAEELGAVRPVLACFGWLCASLFGSSGCSGMGTDLNQLVNVDPFPDGSPETADAGGGSSFQDPFRDAAPYSAQTGKSSHNPGMSCIHSG